MKLKKLIKDLPKIEVRGSKEIEITGVCANSKLVAPGNLFIAKKGIKTDGAAYIPDAIAAGATAVLTDIYDPFLKQITQLICSDINQAEGALAATYNGFPSDQLFCVGVTGTNGKTTVSYLIKHLLDKMQSPCGLIGTIEYLIGKMRYQATHTTPDVTKNQKMLKEMVTQGCSSAVLEVTSHALEQGRVNHIAFDVAVYTNLSQEHLDYHTTMDAYAEAKAKLFKSKDLKTSVINKDDFYANLMIKSSHAKVLTYGISQEADLKAEAVELTAQGTSFTLCYQGKKYPVKTPLIGRYNVYNALAAIGTLLTRFVEPEQIIKHLETFPGVSGRLEPVENKLGIKIFVDFAHTPDALENVLSCLSEFKTGKIIVVFGCGGDRDSTKREKMARVCEKYADFCIVTSDNPRSEKPVDIIQQIIEGFTDPAKFTTQEDRALAIKQAIEMAKRGDMILIAGRGHEPYQIFAHGTVEFDDREVAAKLSQEGVEYAV